MPETAAQPRILVVEDNEMNRDMLTRRLARNGFATIVAESAEQALDLIATDRPDLILMDVQLPGISGLEATQRLKADPATRDIPVVALTAQTLQGDREKGLEAGCDEYETKPVDLPRLVAKMRALLAR